MLVARCVFIENETEQQSGRFASDPLTTLRQVDLCVGTSTAERYARYHEYDKLVSNRTECFGCVFNFSLRFPSFGAHWFAFCLCMFFFCFCFWPTEIFAIDVIVQRLNFTSDSFNLFHHIRCSFIKLFLSQVHKNAKIAFHFMVDHKIMISFQKITLFMNCSAAFANHFLCGRFNKIDASKVENDL